MEHYFCNNFPLSFGWYLTFVAAATAPRFSGTVPYRLAFSHRRHICLNALVAQPSTIENYLSALSFCPIEPFPTLFSAQSREYKLFFFTSPPPSRSLYIILVSLLPCDWFISRRRRHGFRQTFVWAHRSHCSSVDSTNAQT